MRPRSVVFPSAAMRRCEFAVLQMGLSPEVLLPAGFDVREVPSLRSQNGAAKLLHPFVDCCGSIPLSRDENRIPPGTNAFATSAREPVRDFDS